MRFLNSIQKGNSLDFDFQLPDGEEVTDWICTIHVKKKPADADAFSRVILPEGNSWPGYLTQTETAALAQGTWYLIAEMDNSTTDEHVTEQSRFRVTDSWTT